LGASTKIENIHSKTRQSGFLNIIYKCILYTRWI
jgi:hypothetical protein